jgi:hypothetical protein
VKVRFVCAQEYKSRFANSSCLLSISVGQAKHEGEKLKATLKKVNETFANCTIMLADSLQRFNLKINSPNLSYKKLHADANKLGNVWLERNNEIIEKSLSIPFKIIRWDSFLNHPDFKLNRKLVEVMYNENAVFRRLVFNCIKEYMLRLHKNPDLNLNPINLLKYSTEYIMEECAAKLTFSKLGFDFEIYPTHLSNHPMQQIFDLLDIKSKLPTISLEFD